MGMDSFRYDRYRENERELSGSCDFELVSSNASNHSNHRGAKNSSKENVDNIFSSGVCSSFRIVGVCAAFVKRFKMTKKKQSENIFLVVCESGFCSFGAFPRENRIFENQLYDSGKALQRIVGWNYEHAFDFRR